MLPIRDTVNDFIQDMEPYFHGKKITYVDLGAYKGGVFTRFLNSGLEFAEAHLFEPNPQSFKALKRIPKASVRNRSLHVYNIAVGASRGMVRMQAAGTMSRVISKDPSDGTASSADVTSFIAECHTLDELRQSFTDGRISILKIDVEGSEEEVLRGAQGILADQAVDVIYIEAGANPHGQQQCYFPTLENLLTLHGYRLFRIYEQQHEWSEDLPILRRMNCAYFSSRFAERHPYQLTQASFEAWKATQSHPAPEGLTSGTNQTAPDALIAKITEIDRRNKISSATQKALGDRIEMLLAHMADFQQVGWNLAQLQESLAERVQRLEDQTLKRKRAELVVSRGPTERHRKKGRLSKIAGIYGSRWARRLWRAAGIGRLLDRMVLSRRLRRARRLIENSDIFDRIRSTDRGGRGPAKQGQPEVTVAATVPQTSLSRRPSDNKRTIFATRTRLFSFGFHQRALKAFQAMVDQDEDAALRRLAAWELATFRASSVSGSQAELRDCLRLLELAEDGKRSRKKFRHIAIMRAECLKRLGSEAEARRVLSTLLVQDSHPDLYFGMANLESSAPNRLEWINKCFKKHELPELTLSNAPERSLYDRIRALVDPMGTTVSDDGDAKVSIIIPAYNSEHSIDVALESLLVQTWKNLEILIVDDCSSDATCDVVKRYAKRDSRIRLLAAPRNSGPYVARNIALKAASGEFITCHDADDWSHPMKIETQAAHLVSDRNVVANMSPQARTLEDLTFCRCGKPGIYVRPNMSSLMFRRELLLEKIGYWDSVRFAGDSEYLQRIRCAFGPHSVVNLGTAPLSFQRQSVASLTGSVDFGYDGFKMGARKAYEAGHQRFHRSIQNPYIGFPLEDRPFAVPDPMRPDREVAPGDVRHFDVVLVSDFRFPGGTSGSNLEEIRVQSAMGLRTGLIQLSCYELEVDRHLHPAISQLIDEGKAELLVYGENVECDLLVVRHPWVLQDRQAYVPRVRAKNIRVVVNQPPMKNYARGARQLYSIRDCATNAKEYFGDAGVWQPIGPLVRKALLDHHASDLNSIVLAEKDWINIINVGEWRRPYRPERHDRIRLCRHSRDSKVKWPESPADLLKIYPDSGPYEVHVLGGARTPKKLLKGVLPPNWRVVEFGKMAPRDFLAACDVFVYFTHSSWVESFGRVIVEAMAVGLPVILPAVFEPLFKEAALYATPGEVVRRVDEIMTDDHAYEAQAARAIAFVESRFGPSQHERRLNEILERG